MKIQRGFYSVVEKKITEAHYNVKLPSKRSNKWAAWIEGNISVENGAMQYTGNHVYAHDSWNGSFHECMHFDSFVVGFGRHPGQAVKRLRKLLESKVVRVIEDDPVSIRAMARRYTRPGD